MEVVERAAHGRTISVVKDVVQMLMVGAPNALIHGLHVSARHPHEG